MRKILLTFVLAVAAAFNLSAQTDGTISVDNDDFKVSISNVTFCDFDIKLEPKVTDMRYVIGARALKSLQEDYGDVSIDEAINAFEKEYYEMFASWYTDKTWLDIRAIMSQNGVLDAACSELLGRLDYNTDIVFYVYGVDDAGNAITDITKLDVRTLGPTPVDMTFNVTFNEVTATSVSATIVPSVNDQPYYLNIQSTAFTDGWADDPEGMMLKLVYGSLPKEAYELMWVDGGTYELAPTTFNIKKNRHYNLILFGFNNGPTTQPYMFPFSTYEEDLPVDAILTTDGQKAGNVYSLDGKLVMKSAAPENIQKLPKGVYVINKKKVVVR